MLQKVYVIYLNTLVSIPVIISVVKWVFQAYLAFIVLTTSKLNQIILINRVRTLLTECGILREGFVSGGWVEVYGLGRSHWPYINLVYIRQFNDFFSVCFPISIYLVSCK